jgi:hypothetical protein
VRNTDTWACERTLEDDEGVTCLIVYGGMDKLLRAQWLRRQHNQSMGGGVKGAYEDTRSRLRW